MLSKLFKLQTGVAVLPSLSTVTKMLYCFVFDFYFTNIKGAFSPSVVSEY